MCGFVESKSNKIIAVHKRGIPRYLGFCYHFSLDNKNKCMCGKHFISCDILVYFKYELKKLKSMEEFTVKKHFNNTNYANSHVFHSLFCLRQYK